MYEIKDENLSAAVQAVLAAKKGSFLEAQSYQNEMTVTYTDDQWQVAHNIAYEIERGEGGWKIANTVKNQR